MQDLVRHSHVTCPADGGVRVSLMLYYWSLDLKSQSFQCDVVPVCLYDSALDAATVCSKVDI